MVGWDRIGMAWRGVRGIGVAKVFCCVVVFFWGGKGGLLGGRYMEDV